MGAYVVQLLLIEFTTMDGSVQEVFLTELKVMVPSAAFLFSLMLLKTLRKCPLSCQQALLSIHIFAEANILGLGRRGAHVRVHIRMFSLTR